MVRENVNEYKDSDKFGIDGDLSTSLELVASNLEAVSYEINTSIDSRDGVESSTRSTFHLLSTKSHKLRDSSENSHI